ncbi:MAG: putative sulfate exporter family transporter [Prochloraceae cyanobacterium]|nr:putative sulfate exporter family transporter [Prochloraceae cyanobacterium]
MSSASKQEKDNFNKKKANYSLKQAQWSDLYKQEDWWAVWIGLALLGTVFSGVVTKVPKMPKWQGIDLAAAIPFELIPQIALLAIGLGFFFVVGNLAMKGAKGLNIVPGFAVVFLLSTVAYILANSQTAKAIGLGYAFWALLIGLAISNTIGTPKWLLNGSRTEYYIKTGLVILGAEILFNRIVEFGPYGLAIAWFVTPVVIFFMYIFGTKILKISQKSLVIVVATSTSVCGVSAAIAAAAASKAKKAELTLAVGMTLIFTVIMMVIMPLFVKAIGMQPELAGAWMGGTIDATGAVVAAGEAVGDTAGKVAALVKMIQNMLIGIVAFGIACFWVWKVERNPNAPTPGLGELWVRLPKFILGFVAASLLASFVFIPMMGMEQVRDFLSQTKTYRGWLFCMAFLAIGLESNFRELGSQFQGGKPMMLYIVGQTFNLVLTLFVAWVALSGNFFPIPQL